MVKIRNLTGINKFIFIIKLKIHIFFHFISALFKGDISLRRFIFFLRRMLLFLSKIKHNKFVKIGNETKIDLYVPGFPSRAFYTACNKFLEFDKQLPCTIVLISITSACKFKCSHCYQKFDKGKDVDINVLTEIVKKLQDMGIAFFNIEGGEPFLVYERLKRICSSIDARSEIWINSTGLDITKERLNELKKLNVTAIMFSFHSYEPDKFNSFMGKKYAWDILVSAISLCHEAKIAVALNCCLMKDDFYNGNFEKIMEKAKEFNVSIVQVIKPKPSGGWLGSENIEFSQDDFIYIKEKINKYNLKKEYRDYPSISAQIIEEDENVFGCTAGGIDRFYINAKGDLQPCEFLNISFGNIVSQEFNVIYEKMRNCSSWGGTYFPCERYSKDIYKLYNDNNISSLPLEPNLSEKIYSAWDLGSKTYFYEKLEKLK